MSDMELGRRTIRRHFLNAFFMLALFLSAVPAHAIQWNSATNSYDWAETLVNASPGGQTSSTATTVKASHVQEILEAIADIRANAACGALPVDSVVTAATYNAATGSLISSQHIQGLRDAIKRIRPSASGVPASAAGGTNSVWGNSITTNSSTQIKASDFQDMRLALNQIRASCGGSVPVCGNGGPLEAGEQCDDGNTANGDGCSSTCQNESACTLQVISSYMVCKAFTDPGSTCGAITLGSACTLPGPSCQSSSTENEFNLPGGPCDVPGPGGWWSGFVQDVGCACGAAPVCGNGGLPEGSEQCDDGNVFDGDGCSSACQIESPCIPNGGQLSALGVCQPGDNIFQPPTADGTGQCCSGFIRQSCATFFDPWEITCVAAPGPVCGNGGAPESGEQCDDGNTNNGDGCSSACQNEAPSICPFGSSIIGPPPLYMDEQGCISMGNADCGALGRTFSGSCGGSFQPCCQDNAICGNTSCEYNETPANCPADCAPDPCSNPTTCDDSGFGPTVGGLCGCGNPSGTTITTTGPGCRTYQCNNGNWINVGSGALCQLVGSCN